MDHKTYLIYKGIVLVLVTYVASQVLLPVTFDLMQVSGSAKGWAQWFILLNHLVIGLSFIFLFNFFRIYGTFLGLGVGCLYLVFLNFKFIFYRGNYDSYLTLVHFIQLILTIKIYKDNKQIGLFHDICIGGAVIVWWYIVSHV